ncbi:MAG TPA: hypothetical protein VFE05_02855 [Longimicrobiaceae bacterium]|jgi:hypothetical protein|nr:hypothetical protein [Longimicrobiaceae bacterium]
MQTLPMDVPKVILFTAIAITMVVPVVGITARIALRPIVDAMARLRESSGRNDALTMVERRLALVEQELQAIEGIRTDVRRLVEEDEFRRQLTLPNTAQPE